MTERIYFNNDELELATTVLGCSLHEDGHYHVVLAATLFHPQGGGQPSDTGLIGSASMLQAVQGDDGVIHVTDTPLELGPVILKVDSETRALHSRYHSAGHLIASVGEKYGWRALKGNHRPGEGRVVFELTGQAQPMTEDILRADIVSLIARDLPREIASSEGRRTVTWGELSATACGGTHVQSTQEVGNIRIVRVKQKKEQLSVQYELD
ncbi:alanyl-tRNA editing protein [Pseudomonas sp. JDS28PS106]|uniref:alanyl-tRNA editing protein n=1 Tax=Pseudomonas sp. JDS28PS106 TaxID=2497235 RepID=UPI002FD76885